MIKDLYDLGDAPELGAVPKRMYASVIRRERYGEPVDAFRTEVVDVPPVRPGQVLVKVMAAGVNYNNVWAALGSPLDVITARQKQGAAEDFHIGGSDLSGVVWAVGENVRGVKPGDEVVVLAARWDESAEDVRLGAEPITSTSQRVWGYEENYGSFAQFAVVDDYMCHPKAKPGCPGRRRPATWRRRRPPTVSCSAGSRTPSAPATRSWSGAARAASAASPSSSSGMSAAYPWPSSPARSAASSAWGSAPRAGSTGGTSTTGAACRTPRTRRPWPSGCPGRGRSAAVSGRCSASGGRRGSCWSTPAPTPFRRRCTSATTPAMVVICGGTTGYNGDVDLRFLWMRQKRLQGSHVASLREAREVTRLIDQGAVDPCLSRTFGFEEIGLAHQLLHENRHPAGNMAVLVNASE